MTEFLNLLSPQDAIKLLEKNLAKDFLQIVMIPTIESLGKVVARDIRSLHPLPYFPRSMVDGYAVYSSDTFGASDSLPTYLALIGEVQMGKNTNYVHALGQAFLIHTGGMLPSNSDAVIMVEDTQKVDTDEVEIRKAVAPGENVLGIGEEIGKDEVVIPAGVKMRSVEIGGLMALGIMDLAVRASPKIGIISSGDEIVQPNQELRNGQVRDVNSYLLSALVTQWGGDPIPYGIVPDNLNDLLVVAKRAHAECDVVIFTAGSSVSMRDMTAEAIKSLGKPGVLAHGVNIRPGKPTILAVCSGKPVIGLPGNPVSAYVTAKLFVAPLIRYLLGLKNEGFQPTIRAELQANVPSQAGREDWVPVKLEKFGNDWKAIPIFTKSNFIFSLVSSSGLMCIPADHTGAEAGEFVDVFLCD
ncbi:MAG: molybdopterin molybdenumtransferase MoeA [Chloroflexi bacterium GWB2_49_20]|nr:MAG: molybdopterin molybdenumtransferase MoeA [Chloroflexi bacterium GWB2_49_20]OGN78906.1 MAG: molybdopterin molybdenumtransferase MoeA [Chloroflexi bacterium GWC2_49_37]OGN86333.1 MAG: molybdopterin molybdenumtransferase MoeA [Chloroflexi bacterium GWD2_49_16]HBG74564.1 molybdopterin molybdenumtransferase MoeA [Anaerolineae bacterium]